jgi:hypothetical protein
VDDTEEGGSVAVVFISFVFSFCSGTTTVTFFFSCSLSLSLIRVVRRTDGHSLTFVDRTCAQTEEGNHHSCHRGLPREGSFVRFRFSFLTLHTHTRTHAEQRRLPHQQHKETNNCNVSIKRAAVQVCCNNCHNPNA